MSLKWKKGNGKNISGIQADHSCHQRRKAPACRQKCPGNSEATVNQSNELHRKGGDEPWTIFPGKKKGDNSQTPLPWGLSRINKWNEWAMKYKEGRKDVNNKLSHRESIIQGGIFKWWVLQTSICRIKTKMPKQLKFQDRM